MEKHEKTNGYFFACFMIWLSEDQKENRKKRAEFEKKLFLRFGRELEAVTFSEEDGYICIFSPNLDGELWLLELIGLLGTFYENYIVCYSQEAVERERMGQRIEGLRRLLKKQLFMRGGYVIGDSEIPLLGENDMAGLAEELHWRVLEEENCENWRKLVEDKLKNLKHIGKKEAKELLIELTFKNNEEVTADLRKLLSKQLEKLPATIEELEESCCMILKEKIRLREDGESEETGEEQIVQEMKTYIRKNICEDITCAVIAEDMGYSPGYLSRVFSKQEGKTIVKYIQEEKMREAKRLAEETKLKISEISVKLGYSNFSYFSRLFQRENGCSVKECRRR